MVTAYATVLYALVVEVPPLAFLVPFFLLYATTVNLGTFFLNLQAFVDTVSRGPEGARGVALTFDDGPHPIHTREVLDVLDAHGARATFFVIGDKAAAHPDVVREIAARGHWVATHTMHHDRFLNLREERSIERDIEASRDLIESLTGQRPSLFRPPVGFTSPRVRVAVRRLGLTVVGWTLRAYDGLAVTTAAAIVRRIVPRLGDGAIVLLHDAAEVGDRRPPTLDALPAILEAMKERRLEAVSISSWTASPVGSLVHESAA